MLQDIELLESGSILKGLRFPHKIKNVTQIVITAGQFSCLVDFRMWSLKAPAVALFLPGQVVESIDLDEDFSGFGMVVSQNFTDSLNLPVSLQERLQPAQLSEDLPLNHSCLAIPSVIPYIYTINQNYQRETLTKHHNSSEDSRLYRLAILQYKRLDVLDTICPLWHQ